MARRNPRFFAIYSNKLWRDIMNKKDLLREIIKDPQIKALYNEGFDRHLIHRLILEALSEEEIKGFYNSNKKTKYYIKLAKRYHTDKLSEKVIKDAFKAEYQKVGLDYEKEKEYKKFIKKYGPTASRQLNQTEEEKQNFADGAELYEKRKTARDAAEERVKEFQKSSDFLDAEESYKETNELKKVSDR